MAIKESVTKDKIISTSWKLLQQEGLELFSMSQLSKKLDLTVSSIYWHFNSKEAIFQELINQVNEFHNSYPLCPNEFGT